VRSLLIVVSFAALVGCAAPPPPPPTPPTVAAGPIRFRRSPHTVEVQRLPASPGDVADVATGLFVLLEVRSIHTTDEAVAAVGIDFPAPWWHRQARRATGPRFSGLFPDDPFAETAPWPTSRNVVPLDPFQVTAVSSILESVWSRHPTSEPVVALTLHERGRFAVYRKPAQGDALDVNEFVTLDMRPAILDEARSIRVDVISTRRSSGEVRVEEATFVLRDGGTAMLRLGESGERRWFLVTAWVISLRDEDQREYRVERD
jgi:hypothetical protein